MKALKYAIVTAILTLGIAAPAVSAQDNATAPGKGRQHQGPQGPRAGHGSDMATPLLKGITLTDDQQKKVEAINADFQKQVQALTPEERRTKGREIMQTRTDKVRAVLTADQQKVFDQNVKDMQSRFQGKGGPGGRGAKGGKGGAPKAAPAADSEE